MIDRKDDVSTRPSGLSRRRLVQRVTAAGVVAALGLAGWQWRRSVRREARIPDTPDERTRVFEVVGAFAGACFGHKLTSAEVAELVTSLRAVAVIDPALAARFPLVAEFADHAAVARGASSFATSSLDVRNAIIEDLMATPVNSRRSQLLAQVSRHERNRRRVRWEVMHRLPRIYSGSGPAWRRRGYVRWPGVGGDPREYTRAGSPRAC